MKALLSIVLLLAFGACVYSEYTPEQIARLEELAANETGTIHLSLTQIYKNLASAYNRGGGVPEDKKEAIKWYRKAAEQGDVSSQWKLGYMYSRGEGGYFKNYREAVKWYRMAAEQEEVSMNRTAAQSAIGDIYDKGNGVLEDDKEAVKWWRKAAAHGASASQFSLGFAYYWGEGVPTDYIQAYAWFNISAANQFTLGQEWKAKAAAKLTNKETAEAQDLSKEMLKANPKLLVDLSPLP